jgi:hypothetical protein
MKIYINKWEDYFDANFDNDGVADLFCAAGAHFSTKHNLFLGTGNMTYTTEGTPNNVPYSYTITLREYVLSTTIDYKGFMSYIESLGVEVEYYDCKINREEIR